MLPLSGQRVTARLYDYVLVVLTEADYEFQIESSTQLEAGTGEKVILSFDGQGNRNIDLDRFFAGTVLAATVDPSGTLTVTMDSDSRMTVRADPDFEAWTLTGPHGYRVVCMPGGEIAKWTSRD